MRQKYTIFHIEVSEDRKFDKWYSRLVGERFYAIEVNIGKEKYFALVDKLDNDYTAPKIYLKIPVKCAIVLTAHIFRTESSALQKMKEAIETTYA